MEWNGREGNGREGKGREGKGREGKGREGKGREGKGREGKGREKGRKKGEIYIDRPRRRQEQSGRKADVVGDGSDGPHVVNV